MEVPKKKGLLDRISASELERTFSLPSAAQVDNTAVNYSTYQVFSGSWIYYLISQQHNSIKTISPSKQQSIEIH